MKLQTLYPTTSKVSRLTGLDKRGGLKPSELFELYGPDWARKFNLLQLPKVFNKKIINNFYDFDEDTKAKYITIAKNIKLVNIEDFDVWAIGSRIHGCWKTNEEAELLTQQYGLSKPKYSDYDFTTSAKNIPSFNHLDFHCHVTNNTEIKIKILIPREEYY